ncbi:MAG: dTDP-4-amino-4,6-dideoxygalactose transaminase [Acidimicrobiia bacterium]|nr:dTDP-4-amino-4,6-dideoxygalactose transaminase [Acidimicrobiia bacterium]
MQARPAFIPFNRFRQAGAEIEYIREAMESLHVSGDGPFTARCQELLEQELGAAKVLLTTSCTHALEMAALLLDLKEGDEVVLPSFTFVSTANAFVLHGARPVFADIRPDTLNLDESRLEELVTPRTKAIVPVHYAGVGCEMEAVMAISGRNGIAVIEDNAHGLFGTYKAKQLGSFGALSAQSFHETKNFSCGEGGALVINDAGYVERAEIVREKGTNRKRFFRGEVDKYTWVDVGSSYLPSDILAAILYAQLEQRDLIERERRKIWDAYRRELSNWAGENGVALPEAPAHCRHPAHLFYLVLPSGQDQARFLAHMKQRNILVVFHYQPLHLSEMGRRYGGKAGDCPVTESVSGRLVRLPFYRGLTEADMERVVEAVRAFRCG